MGSLGVIPAKARHDPPRFHTFPKVALLAPGLATMAPAAATKFGKIPEMVECLALQVSRGWLPLVASNY